MMHRESDPVIMLGTVLIFLIWVLGAVAGFFVRGCLR